MEVTVTIPDSLFEQIESLACQQDKSHTALVVQALRNLVESGNEAERVRPAGNDRPEWLDWSDEEITQGLNEFAADHNTALGHGLASAQMRALKDKWEWD